MFARQASLLCTCIIVVACSESPLDVPHRALDRQNTVSAAAFVPDEQQTAMNTDYSWAIGVAGVGQVVVQTFTPGTNGRLGYLELPVRCESGVLLNVKIRDGLNGSVLYEANVAGLQNDIGAWQLIQVYDPATSNGIKLHKNHEYAFQLEAFAGPDATVATCGIAHGPSYDSYARGRAYAQDPVNGPDFLPLSDGASTSLDLPFITLAR